MKRYRDVILLWPSYPDLGEDLGLDGTRIGKGARVQKWFERDRIPPEFWKDLIAAAERRGFKGVTLDLLAEIAKERSEPSYTKRDALEMALAG